MEKQRANGEAETAPIRDYTVGESGEEENELKATARELEDVV